MKKRFNVTGVCHPWEHYMADISAKFARTKEMVEQGDYFTINRPRQYGKTTMLFRLTDTLNKQGDYWVFALSFEGVGDLVFQDEVRLSKRFLIWMADEARRLGEALANWLEAQSAICDGFESLSKIITELADKSDRKLVVLIDEVDKSSDNQLFLHFLGVLRNKYLMRHRMKTFHSVILAGVHDVKSLKLKLRPDAERKYNSPWNIAADFKVNMDLQPSEIVPMLEEYARDREVEIDAQAVADRLFYYTSGYPFLVSKLCKIFDEDMLREKPERTWTPHDIDLAARQLVREDNPNFQELTKNLENNRPLYDVTQAIVINEKHFSFDLRDPLISLGMAYGIFADHNGLAIHNRIYHEVIDSYMTSALLLRNLDLPSPEYPGTYLLPGNRFDAKKALRKFQELMKEEYSKHDRDFLERQGRLVFLAFLRPILNGHGSAFKEPQISEERRLDIIISYHQHRHVIELKIWRGKEAHQRGLDQLAAYLESLGLDEGALLIFDHKGVKEWKQQEIVHNGKRIFAVWV